MFAPIADMTFARRTSSSARANRADIVDARTLFHVSQIQTNRTTHIRGSNSHLLLRRPQNATSTITPPFSNSPQKSHAKKSRRHTSSSYSGIIQTEFSIWGGSFRRLRTVRHRRLLRHMITLVASITCKPSPEKSDAAARAVRPACHYYLP